jgi:acetyltransferase (GNAT) family protein
MVEIDRRRAVDRRARERARSRATAVTNLVNFKPRKLPIEEMSARPSPSFQPAAPRQPPVPLSMRLWGLDWSRILPWTIDDAVSVDPGSFEQALPFMQEHYGEIFGGGEGRFLAEPMTEAKRRFCAEMDILFFRANGAAVGIFIGHPTDWSTYYIRSTAFIEEYRARGLMRIFLVAFWRTLREAGVARVESDVSPSNQPTLALQMKEGFVVTGAGTSERWGSILRLTKFLSPESEEVFARQFCSMPDRTIKFDHHQARSRS